jgi:hypothetical protein
MKPHILLTSVAVVMLALENVESTVPGRTR